MRCANLAAFGGDAAADIAAYEQIHAMGLEMADFTSGGVIHGPAQFQREICVE